MASRLGEWHRVSLSDKAEPSQSTYKKKKCEIGSERFNLQTEQYLTNNRCRSESGEFKVLRPQSSFPEWPLVWDPGSSSSASLHTSPLVPWRWTHPSAEEETPLNNSSNSIYLKCPYYAVLKGPKFVLEIYNRFVRKWFVRRFSFSKPLFSTSLLCLD